MAKRQLHFKTGTTYLITGPAKRERKIKFLGRAKLEGKEVLMFRYTKKARKKRRKGKSP